MDLNTNNTGAVEDSKPGMDFDIEEPDNLNVDLVDSKFCIRFSPNFGRYLVATEDIESHELLIDEKPVVVAPSGEYDINPQTQRPQPICIGCLKSQNLIENNNNGGTKANINNDNCTKFQKCPSCSWPICETRCVGIENFHSTEECGLFRSKGIIQSPRSLRMVYLIRCCLMAETNPDNWVKLQQLASKSVSDVVENTSGGTDPILNPFLEQDEQDYRFITDVCGFDPGKLPKPLVFRINGVRRVNGFGFYNTESDTIRFYGMALYFMASMASHGCTPNMTTQVVYDPRESFPMRFRTKMDVAEGQLLKIAYRSYWLELGTLRRREKIFQDHKFLCQCDRCEDPRENDTDFSSIKCELCQNGYLLPEVPLDLDSLWKCDSNSDNGNGGSSSSGSPSSGCPNVKTELEITHILESITDAIEKTLQIDLETDLNKLEFDIDIDGDDLLSENSFYKIQIENPQEVTNILHQNRRNKRRKFDELTKILSGSAKDVLHENHYLIMRAEVEWIRHFPFEMLHQHKQELHTNLELLAELPKTSLEEIETDIWKLFVLLVERGEHCKMVYSKLIPDWADKNHFIDIAIGRAYQIYYLEHTTSIISNSNSNCETQNPTTEILDTNSHPATNFHPDLLLDLLKTNLKYFQNGLRFEDPFSNVASAVKSNCKIIQANITHLLSAGSCD